jgi:hypothetical protein
LEPAPNSGDRGDFFDLALKDWEATSAIASVTIAGVEARIRVNDIFATVADHIAAGRTPPSTASGELVLRVEVPNGSAEGLQRIFARTANGTDRDVAFTVAGAKVTPSVLNVVPNLDLVVNGSGFTEGGGARLCETGMTVAGVVAQINPNSTNGTIAAGNATATCVVGDDFVTITSGGTFVVTLIIPIAAATLSEGQKEAKFTDSLGRTGSANVTMTKRAIKVTPESSGPRSLLQVELTGFPADNDDSGASNNVTVTYDCGLNCRDTESDTPDNTGTLKVVLEVPSQTAIPSDNTIRAEISGQTTVTTVKHSVPNASVNISVLEGMPGSIVTVNGVAFQAFTNVARVEIGGLNALGNLTVNTDSAGNFSVKDIQVPDLDDGTHSVIVRVGTGTRETTANTVFRVLPREGTPLGGPAPIAPMAIKDAVATPLGADYGRTYSYDNVTGWAYHDPRPQFEAFNTLKEVNAGKVYWIFSNTAKTITFCNKSTPIVKGWGQYVC